MHTRTDHSFRQDVLATRVDTLVLSIQEVTLDREVRYYDVVRLSCQMRPRFMYATRIEASIRA